MRCTRLLTPRFIKVVAGPKPCVFRGWDSDVVHFEQFLFGGE